MNRHRSSSWSDAVARGQAYVPAGGRCRACGTDCHPTYAVGGVCLDCIVPGRAWSSTRGRVAERLAADIPAPRRRAAAIIPTMKPSTVSTLPDRQRAVYTALMAGLTVRAIARRDGVMPSAVSAIVAKLRQRCA